MPFYRSKRLTGVMKKVRKKNEFKLEGPAVPGFKRNKHYHVKRFLKARVLVRGPHHYWEVGRKDPPGKMTDEPLRALRTEIPLWDVMASP